MQPVLRIVWNDNKGKTVQYLISDISWLSHASIPILLLYWYKLFQFCIPIVKNFVLFTFSIYWLMILSICSIKNTFKNEKKIIYFRNVRLSSHFQISLGNF